MKKPKKHLFCVGHTNLSLRLPDEAYLLRTSNAGLRDGAHRNLISLGEVSEELDFHYPYLGGSAAVLALPDVFKIMNISCSSDDQIMVFQQAKIVAKKEIGWKSKTYPGMMVLPQWLAEGIDVGRIAVDSEKFLFPQLVSQPGGEMNLYARSHYLPDYLRFCAIAIDEGVLTSSQVVEMSKQDILIPGGGILGVSPLEYSLSVIESAKIVALSFLNKHRPGLFSPYQRIAMGYCMERMCSYLLINKLIADYGGIPREFMGYMIAATDSDYTHGLSSR